MNKSVKRDVCYKHLVLHVLQQITPNIEQKSVVSSKIETIRQLFLLLLEDSGRGIQITLREYPVYLCRSWGLCIF